MNTIKTYNTQFFSQNNSQHIHTQTHTRFTRPLEPIYTYIYILPGPSHRASHRRRISFSSAQNFTIKLTLRRIHCVVGILRVQFVVLVVEQFRYRRILRLNVERFLVFFGSTFACSFFCVLYHSKYSDGMIDAILLRETKMSSRTHTHKRI